LRTYRLLKTAAGGSPDYPQPIDSVVLFSHLNSPASRQIFDEEEIGYSQQDTAISMFKFGLSCSYGGQGWPTLPFSALYGTTRRADGLYFSIQTIPPYGQAIHYSATAAMLKNYFQSAIILKARSITQIK